MKRPTCLWLLLWATLLLGSLVLQSHGSVSREEEEEHKSLFARLREGAAAILTGRNDQGTENKAPTSKELKRDRVVPSTVEVQIEEPAKLGLVRETLVDKGIEAVEKVDAVRCATCEKVDEARQAVKEGVKEGVQEVRNAAAEAGRAATEKAHNLRTNVKEGINEAEEKISRAASAVEEKAKQARNAAANMADRAAECVKEGGHSVMNAASESAASLKDTVKIGMEKAREVISDTAAKAEEGVREAKERAAETADEAKRSIKRGVDQVRESAADTTESLKRKARDAKHALKDGARRARDAAVDLGEDVKEGVSQAEETVAEKMHEFKDGLRSGVHEEEAKDKMESAANKAVGNNHREKERAARDGKREARARAAKDRRGKSGPAFHHEGRPLREKTTRLKADLEALNPDTITQTAEVEGERVARQERRAREAENREAEKSRGMRGVWENAKDKMKKVKDAVTGKTTEVSEELKEDALVEAYNRAKVRAMQAMNKAVSMLGTDALRDKALPTMREALHLTEEAERYAKARLERLLSLSHDDEYERRIKAVGDMTYQRALKEAEDASAYIARMKASINQHIEVKGIVAQEHFDWSETAKEDLLRPMPDDASVAAAA
jgi:hypothetical protein